jgi:hypothetical protein
MASASKKTHITQDEYLVRERAAQFKSEFHRGRIRAMSGASYPHNQIAMNMAGELHAQLKGRPCEAFMADMRILDGPTGDSTTPISWPPAASPNFSTPHSTLSPTRN